MAQEETDILVIPDFVTVRDLADLMGASPIEVMKQLIANGIMASINQQIDYDTAAIVIAEMGFESIPEREVAAEQERQKALESLPAWRKEYAKEDEASLHPRPPVVTILGHVDHGKTSLLDVIRKTAVAEGEAGGITQHIGAYQVIHNDQKLTFLDTPGHAAFTAMRARGAHGADIAVLVVAADDGVMPTTREAVNHAKAAGVPIVVALNKIDRPNASPEQVKQQLAEINLTPDDWDGDTMVVPVSAKEATGIEDLLEAILLVAGEQQIHANPDRLATGVVLESRIDSGRGPVATLLVQNGTLRTGDIVVVGVASGKIKAMFDENNNRVDSAEPSRPVLIMGLDKLTSAGEPFEATPNSRAARKLVKEHEDQAAGEKLTSAPAQSLEDLFEKFTAGETTELGLIIKVDVDGSLEPVVASVENIELDDNGPKVKVIHAEVGDITENDVNLAQSAGAIIIGFNTGVDAAARKAADNYGVEIRTYSVIYSVIEDIEKALHGLLEPIYEDKVIGRAEVRAVFRIPRVGHIAGSYILDGIARRNAKARVLRGNEEVGQKQNVSSLRRFEENVNEVRSGYECGIGLGGFKDFQDGDIIEFIVSERIN